MSTDPELPPAESETTSKASSSLSKNPTQTKTTSFPSRINSSDDANAGLAESETTSKASSSLRKNPTQTKITSSPSRINSSDEAKAILAESETTSKASSSLSKNPTKTTTSSSPSGIDSSNDANAGPNIISCLNRITKLFPKRVRESQPKQSVASEDAKVKNSARSSSEETSSLIKLIKADLVYIQEGTARLSNHSQELKELLKESEQEFEALEKDKNVEDLRELHKAMNKLKPQIPSKYNSDADALKKFQFPFKSKRSISKEFDKMPRLHKNAIFESSTEFQDFEALYNELDVKVKLCLLCFSIFPENAIIKKRLLVQWWVAEGFASDEEDASKYIRTLMKKGFIEPVNENRSPFVGFYRMHPFYRSVLATLAERAKFFNFDVDGKPTQKFEGSFQACLVGKGLISYEDLKSGSVNVADLEKIHLLINVNEPILDFKPDWFSKMRNVNVLYLGRWKVLATDHIEVEDNINFLDGFKNMNHLRFLSLQGVSNIIKLPKSILKLKNLKILDIRACHNLEEIPKNLGSLKTLTHLDMSECYLLDHIPKSLSSLTNLRVLKGFVVGKNEDKSCTLSDLIKLPYLTKLCIYTGSKKFPPPHHDNALSKLTALRKLTISWGGDALREETKKGSELPSQLEKLDLKCSPESTTPSCLSLKNLKNLRKETKDQADSTVVELPSQLEKLDLKCFPESTTPSWLSQKNLKNLKKLYIRGGKFSDLGQYQDIDNLELLPSEYTWKVQVLRLKYLTEIKMEWRRLQQLFPDLMYLEQVSCPELTLFPCDANGIWTHHTKWEEFQKTQFSDKPASESSSDPGMH